MITIQLVKRQPHKLFIHGLFNFVIKGAGDFPGVRSAIAVLPHKGGGRIKTMGAISFKIINQSFVRQILNNQAIFACTGIRRFSLGHCLMRPTETLLD